MNTAPEYVGARRVLLAALAALGPQRDAIVLVGAQAIYLQVGEADLAVLVMTTDGDLAMDPRRLHDLPLVAEAMTAAGFVPTQPGSWRGAGGVEIDLMVPAMVAGRPGRRGRPRGPRDNRRTPGEGTRGGTGGLRVPPGRQPRASRRAGLRRCCRGACRAARRQAAQAR